MNDEEFVRELLARGFKMDSPLSPIFDEVRKTRMVIGETIIVGDIDSLDPPLRKALYLKMGKEAGMNESELRQFGYRIDWGEFFNGLSDDQKVEILGEAIRLGRRFAEGCGKVGLKVSLFSFGFLVFIGVCNWVVSELSWPWPLLIGAIVVGIGGGALFGFWMNKRSR